MCQLIVSAEILLVTPTLVLEVPFLPSSVIILGDQHAVEIFYI